MTTQLVDGMTLKNQAGAALRLTHEPVSDDSLGTYHQWWLTNPQTQNRRAYSRAEIIVGILFGHLTIQETTP